MLAGAITSLACLAVSSEQGASPQLNSLLRGNSSPGNHCPGLVLGPLAVGWDHWAPWAQRSNGWDSPHTDESFTGLCTGLWALPSTRAAHSTCLQKVSISVGVLSLARSLYRRGTRVAPGEGALLLPPGV